MSKPTRKPAAKLPAYTPAEQIEIAAAETAKRDEAQAWLGRQLFGDECADAEGEAY